MSHLPVLNLTFSRKMASVCRFKMGVLFTLLALPLGSLADAALQIGWESPTEPGVKVLATYELSALGARKLTTLSERDPFGKNPDEVVKFQGISLSQLMTEATKNLSAADRSNTDLVLLKTRAGTEALLPKAFLVKYPDILLALKKNGQDLAAESPRIIIPATTNKGIQKEKVLLLPLFVSELASITLVSYEARYGAFYLEHRMDPSAVRGEKIYLQNCVSCHAKPEVTLASLSTGEKAMKVMSGDHTNVRGLPSFSANFKSLFDKKMSRSLSSYLEAFRKQPLPEKKTTFFEN